MSPRKTLALAVLLAGAAANAQVSSTTLFDSHPYVRNGGYQESPIYESLALSARSDGTSWVQDVRVVARVWGRLSLGAPFDEHRTAGDVDSLFVEGRLLDRHLTVRLGRQLALGGAVRSTQLDGLTLRGLLGYGFGAEVFGGVPVQPRFGQARGDALGGGRLFWRHGFDSEVGASYVYALRRGYVARNDVALDGSYTPIRTVTLSALGQWSLEEERLAEARFQALWQVLPSLQLVGDVQRTSPDLFLDRSSIFAVFAEEVRNEAGGEVTWRPWSPLSLSGDWHWFRVEGGHGHRGGARASFRTATGGTFGAELRLLTQPDNGYKQARVFVIRRIRRDVTLTVDLDGYWLEREVNREKKSLVATATAGWEITPSWEATLAGSFGTTPYFERRTEVIARLIYRFGLPGVLR